MLKSLRRRDILILGAFWISTACVVGLLLLFFMLRAPTTEQPGPTIELPSGDVTAKNLYNLAQDAAQSWAEDVQFVSVSATWNHASVAQLEQPVEWVYRFYSPGLQRILFVIVTPEQEVVVRPHLAKIRRELRIVGSDNWQVDSPAAVSAWLNNGGLEWLQQAADRVVSAQLTQDLESNSPVWTISGLNPETGESVVFTLDAAQP
jgi:hypothetical protein